VIAFTLYRMIRFFCRSGAMRAAERRAWG